MTTQALYNKWRSQSFDDILGQEHITRTLRNQIKAGRIGHAYLFTGLRGTGKTSTARVMAKAVNCVGDTDDPPCNRCHICRSVTQGTLLDLIEIDAASNRGIDEIRDLRDRVNFSPHESRYKVYVIDEVHMLTNEAFNALLKTLEEPPAHVIFILCTTEPHRLPDTILSRCQRFDFRRGSVAVVMAKLTRICEQEGIAISPEALEMVARRASGSFRDAESLLDQLAAYGGQEITTGLVRDVLGSVEWEVVAQLVESLVTRDVPTGLRLINSALDSGAEPGQFLDEILEHLRAVLLIRAGGEDQLQNLSREAVEAMHELVERRRFSLARLLKAIRLFEDAGQGLRHAARPQLPLELALVEATIGGEAQEQDEPSSRGAGEEMAARVGGAPDRALKTSDREAASAVAAARELREVPAQTAPQMAAPATVSAPQAEHEALPEPLARGDEPQTAPLPPADEPEAAPVPTELTLDWVRGNWSLILMKTRPRSHQVRALLNSAYPVAVKGSTITLGCEASFHREKLDEEKRRGLLEGICSEVLGMPVRIECRLQSDVRDMMRVDETPQTSADIFDAKPSSEELRAKLLNHPTVKALQERGGRISKIDLYDEDETGG
ncbi:MAG: DNA polymerase III subunit gamma/tau [Anaerolineae bacterium]|nr:DNA polymerase III subunit gamma/tau [Anaerolineae bacterium]